MCDFVLLRSGHCSQILGTALFQQCIYINADVTNSAEMGSRRERRFHDGRWCQAIAWKYRIMNWVPTVFIVFKVLVLSTGMFFAIKWHYDQGRKEKGAEKLSTVLRAGGKVAAVFTLSLLGLLFLTFRLGTMLGLDLTFP